MSELSADEHSVAAAETARMIDLARDRTDPVAAIVTFLPISEWEQCSWRGPRLRPKPAHAGTQA